MSVSIEDICDACEQMKPFILSKYYKPTPGVEFEDVWQDLLVVSIERIPKVYESGKSSLNTFVARVAQNAIIDIMRKYTRRSRRYVPLTTSELLIQSDASVNRKEDVDMVFRWLRVIVRPELTAQQKMILDYCLLCYPGDVIAKNMGISRVTLQRKKRVIFAIIRQKYAQSKLK